MSRFLIGLVILFLSLPGVSVLTMAATGTSEMTVRKSHLKVRRCICGQIPQVGTDQVGTTLTTFVFCPSCGVRGAGVSSHSLAEADAVGCWNRREMEPQHVWAGSVP